MANELIYAQPHEFLAGTTPGFAEDEAKRQEWYAQQAQHYSAQPGAGLDVTRSDESRAYLSDAARGLEDQARLAGSAGGAYRDFLGQGPGPSAARGQLADAANASRAQAIALSQSGRGAMGGGEAARRAAFSNAATSGTTSLQDQALAAQEDQLWRQREAEALRGAASAYGLEGNLYGAAGDAYNAQRGQDITQTNNIYRNAADRDATAQAWDAYGTQREGQAFDYRATQADANAAYGASATFADQKRRDLIDAENERQRQIQQSRGDAARDATLAVATFGASKISDRRLKTDIRGVSRDELTTLIQALADG